MAEKRYNLTKSESDRLNSLLSVAQIQQEVLNSVTQSYKLYILDVFKRLGVNPVLFKKSKVDLGTGELIITEPDKPRKVIATGKEKKGAN
ncbi:MAG: hypothetical protein KAS32_18780 [Candidatus Peribacteraceae bacterium]|nr:hypothetical protein [Candidatus Peribacteraceae bacterium]